MQVIIAEKPSVAREIAAIVGATNRKDGFIEGNGYAVTWAFGHLVGLAMPQQYGIAGFRRENLPILPSSFILLPRQVREGKEYKADPGVVKQLGILRELFGMAERIIVATDAGREGADLPLHLLLPGMPHPFRAVMDQQPDRPGHPRGVTTPPPRQRIRQPLPLGQSPQRSRLDRRYQRLASACRGCRAGRLVARTGADPTLAIICSVTWRTRRSSPPPISG